MASEQILDKARRKGRGAGFNPDPRFERLSRRAEADGWPREADLSPLRTEVTVERPRQVITRNASPDLGFDRSINPYRGCEHGCIYCFARPSHAWLGLSPGLDFETRLIARPDAPAVLARELSRKGYRPAPIAIGTNTDPYQPVERDRGIMRGLLEVLREFRHPVGVVTKGSLIERDGKLIGSRLIGQNFTDPKYFWGRPSATAPVPYNAAASGGSNLGLLNPALQDAVVGRVKALREADPGNTAPVPVDLVTASASGLDPHISPAAATYQAARVARVRGLTLDAVQTLLAQHTEDRQWGMFGEPRVKVLELNLALDAAR